MDNSYNLVICKTCENREIHDEDYVCGLSGRLCIVPVENINDTCVNYETMKGGLDEKEK